MEKLRFIFPSAVFAMTSCLTAPDTVYIITL